MNLTSDPFEGHDVSWEGARRANLLDFASATTEQKIEWLGQMLELYNELHGLAQQTGQRGSTVNPARAAGQPQAGLSPPQKNEENTDECRTHQSRPDRQA